MEKEYSLNIISLCNEYEELKEFIKNEDRMLYSVIASLLCYDMYQAKPNDFNTAKIHKQIAYSWGRQFMLLYEALPRDYEENGNIIDLKYKFSRLTVNSRLFTNLSKFFLLYNKDIMRSADFRNFGTSYVVKKQYSPKTLFNLHFRENPSYDVPKEVMVVDGQYPLRDGFSGSLQSLYDLYKTNLGLARDAERNVSNYIKYLKQNNPKEDDFKIMMGQQLASLIQLNTSFDPRDILSLSQNAYTLADLKYNLNLQMLDEFIEKIGLSVNKQERLNKADKTIESIAKKKSKITKLGAIKNVVADVAAKAAKKVKSGLKGELDVNADIVASINHLETAINCHDSKKRLRHHDLLERNMLKNICGDLYTHHSNMNYRNIDGSFEQKQIIQEYKTRLRKDDEFRNYIKNFIEKYKAGVQKAELAQDELIRQKLEEIQPLRANITRIYIAWNKVLNFIFAHETKPTYRLTKKIDLATLDINCHLMDRQKYAEKEVVDYCDGDIATTQCQGGKLKEKRRKLVFTVYYDKPILNPKEDFKAYFDIVDDNHLGPHNQMHIDSNLNYAKYSYFIDFWTEFDKDFKTSVVGGVSEKETKNILQKLFTNIFALLPGNERFKEANFYEEILKYVQKYYKDQNLPTKIRNRFVRNIVTKNKILQVSKTSNKSQLI